MRYLQWLSIALAVLAMMYAALWRMQGKGVSRDFMAGYYMGKMEVLEDIKTIYMPAPAAPLDQVEY